MRIEPAHSVTRGRIPRGLLGMLVVVTAVEVFMAHHDLDFWPIMSLDWKSGSRRTLRDARGSEILCFGDSLIKVGVAPPILQARTGRRTYNLALMFGVAPTDYFLLRRVLESGTRPSALVVEFHPGLLEVNYQGGVHPHLLAELLSLRECVELAWSVRDAHFFGVMAVERFLPSLRERDEVRHNLIEALKGQSTTCRETNRLGQRNWKVNRGTQVMPNNPRFQEDEVEKDPWRGFANPMHPHRVNLTYLQRFLRMAERNEIPVFWVIPPWCPELHSRRERAGAEEVYTRFAIRVQAQFPKLTVLDARNAGYPRSAFSDPVHLAKQGTTTLSADVADILRHRLGGSVSGPRWVELPTYRERTLDLPLEDVAESQLALKSPDNARRR